MSLNGGLISHFTCSVNTYYLGKFYDSGDDGFSLKLQIFLLLGSQT